MIKNKVYQIHRNLK